VECKKLGVASVGVEAHPMTDFASSVKVDWEPDPDGLLEHAGEIAIAARAELEATGFDDDQCYDPNSLFGAWNGEERLLKTPFDESRKLLLKDSISPLPLHNVEPAHEREVVAGQLPGVSPELLVASKVLSQNCIHSALRVRDKRLTCENALQRTEHLLTLLAYR
jgi:hypothetical protein